MKLLRTNEFKRGYRSLSPEIRKIAQKKLALMAESLFHPSLRVKKMQGHQNIWEASITMKYRLTFEIKEDTIVLRRIGEHNRVLKKP